MAQEDKVVYLDGRGSGRTGTAIYARFRQLADRRLVAMLRHMLDQVDDALFDRAEKADSNEAQTAYFDAMREARLKRREIERRFEQALSAHHEDPESAHVSAASTRAPGHSELSLLDHDELEESLAVETMVSKARGNQVQRLVHICQRLNGLAGRDIYNENSNPVDPRQIASAFETAVDVLNADIKSRLVIYKLFERHVVGQLGGLYEEINRLLVDAGILPEIRPAAKRPSGEAIRRRQEARTEISRNQAQGLLQTLQQLLGLEVDANTTGGGDERERGSAAWSVEGQEQDGDGAPGQGATVFSIGDVVSVLSGLQQMPEESDDDPALLTFADIRHKLRSGLARRGSGHLGPVENSTIEIVGLLFDNILNDTNLPDRIKALLARLQIPILKVALVDPSLFSRASHPARRLVNEMARAGVSWSDSGQPGGDPLYRRIESIVNHILAEFSDDISLFQRSLEEFESFLGDERERARQIEERTRQAAEGRAKVDGAREQVDEELRLRIGGRQLPDVVHRLLDQAWSKVMFITLLKEGSDSDQYRAQLGVVEQLIWSVEPKNSHDERKRLVSEIPVLLHDLRAGMNAIMFNPVDMTRMFKDLEGEHIRLLSRPLDRRPATAETPPAAATDKRPMPAAKEGDTSSEAAVPEALKPFREQIDAAPIGTWFEFVQDSGKSIRAKLSARLNGGDRLIFVNRAGFKLADRRRDEMTKALSQKRLVVLDDNMLFDKALEAVVTNLRSMATA
ncbi:MAG: DUF1631 domain-containing protein [Aquisalimonadaceae bacterium]